MLKKIMNFIMIFLIIAMVYAAYNTVSNPNDSNDSRGGYNQRKEEREQERAELVEESLSKKSYQDSLISGNYIAGVDIPAGTYDLKAVEGGGNVYSTNPYNGGINAVMGTDEMEDDMYKKEYKNVDLPQGEILSLDGVKLKIHGKNVDIIHSSRKGDPENKITLSSGNYVAGQDFEPGVYNIVAVKGAGNVSSSNHMDLGINAVMGVKSDPIYKVRYNNIALPKGVKLNIDGVTIDLIPVT